LPKNAAHQSLYGRNKLIALFHNPQSVHSAFHIPHSGAAAVLQSEAVEIRDLRNPRDCSPGKSMFSKYVKHVCLLLILVFTAGLAFAGVPKEVQNEYLQKYRNRAMFLKLPVRGFRQIINVGPPPAVDRSNMSQPLSFKVGEQVRITNLEFDSTEVTFTIASTDVSRESELIFRFAAEIEDAFPEKASFDGALAATFTQGLSYTDIDAAKETFIKDQFDDLIQQFATSTGRSSESVIRTISEKNPEYRAAKKEARDATAKLVEVQEQLREEVKNKRELDSELTTARRELTQTRNAVNSGRDERAQLVSERTSLQKDNAQLQTRLQEYEKQVGQLLNDFGIQPDSRANFGKRVEAVSRSFDSLRTERSGLSQKLGQVTAELEKLRATNQDLTADLKESERQNSRLSSELNSLTSDRNSLESRYIQTRRRKEVLENADRLARALRLESRTETRDQGTFEVNDVYLMSKKIGVLEIQVPGKSGGPYEASFSLVSPDTVEFTKEERELYGLLGTKVGVEATWKPGSASVQVIPQGAVTMQEVGPRDKATWSWSFEGPGEGQEKLTLVASLKNKDGEVVPLGSRDYWIAPAGTMAWIKSQFAPLSFGLGALLGGAVLGLFMAFRGGRSASGSQSRTATRDYVAEKRL